MPIRELVRDQGGTRPREQEEFDLLDQLTPWKYGHIKIVTKHDKTLSRHKAHRDPGEQRKPIHEASSTSPAALFYQLLPFLHLNDQITVRPLRPRSVLRLSRPPR